MSAGRFSVIIPTLQRSPLLRSVVDGCVAHPLVAEVIVINNAPAPLAWTSEKVRVLQQADNIFVNAAWNLGAREARGQYLAIVNDDIDVAEGAFTMAARILDRNWFAMVGPDASCFRPSAALKRPRIRVATWRDVDVGYGTFMCLRRENYIPIPEQMKIWGGDDWLFLNQRRPNASLVDVPIRTEMSTTTSSPEFQALRSQEFRVASPILNAAYGTRWWHYPTRALAALRKYRGRLPELTRRLGPQ